MPETPDEEARVHVWNVSVSETIPHPDPLIKEDLFKTLVLHAPRFDSLTAATGFWREGGNQLDDKNYIQAFYSYFFVIEHLYADGKTDKTQVLKAFAKSEEFCRICASTLPRFFGEGRRARSGTL